MRISIVCFGKMRDYLPQGTPGNRAELDVGPDAIVADAIDALGAPRSEVVALLVDGRQAGLGEKLVEGAEVTLMPQFTGGAT
ncbi:MAG: Mut7-C ubiquitin [Actinomycetota bacterium]|nr:Mut7-C ubiquitin [Actinomycetota bacterium]